MRSYSYTYNLYALSFAEELSVPRAQSAAFKAWFAASREWLQPYAAFCFLRELFGTAEHWKWGSLSHPTLKVRPK